MERDASQGARRTACSAGFEELKVAGMQRAWLGNVPLMRYERHFGDRIVRCFVERPASAYDLLRDAAARKPGGEAIVCGGERLT